MRVLLLFVLFLTFFFGVSCKKYAPADDAFFIKPGPVTVSTTAAQGSQNNKITDLWVYVDGRFKGAYPIENTIPIANNDKSVTLDIFAGIKNNGIKETRIFWPFYESLKLDTFVNSGKTIDRPFTFKYKDATVFAWNENFEGQGYAIIKSAKSETGFEVLSGSESLEGRYLHIAGSSTASILQIESTGQGFALPLGTPNVYLELNYKCNGPVTIGLIAADGTEKEAFYLNEQPNWNKIYISLAATVNNSPATSKHKVYMRMLKLGDTYPELFLDNIKLVYL